MRDYIHVEDLGAAHLLALDAHPAAASHQIYNLGNGHGFSVREVIDAARRGHRAGDRASRGAPPPGRPAAARGRRRERAATSSAGCREARARDDDRRRVGVAPGAPDGYGYGARERPLRPARPSSSGSSARRVGEHGPRLRDASRTRDPLGLGRGQRVVGAPRCGEERLRLALEAVGVLARPPARARPRAGSMRSSSVRSGVRPPVANALIARTASHARARGPPPW